MSGHWHDGLDTGRPGKADRGRQGEVTHAMGLAVKGSDKELPKAIAAGNRATQAT
jgi:hypothetical protein